MSRTEHDPAERHLVEECLAGKPDAWEELYQRLLQRAATAFRRAYKSVNRYVPDEIAAEVFEDLYEHKDKLQAFYRWTKLLDDFLDYRLWLAVKRQAEKDKRQGAKQVPVSGIDPPDVTLDHLPDDVWEELEWWCATPREKEYVRWYRRVLEGEALPCPIPDSYARRLRRRIEEKLREILRRQ